VELQIDQWDYKQTSKTKNTLSGLKKFGGTMKRSVGLYLHQWDYNNFSGTTKKSMWL